MHKQLLTGLQKSIISSNFSPELFLNHFLLPSQKLAAPPVTLAWDVSVGVTVSTVETVLSTVEAVRLGVLMASLGRIVRHVSIVVCLGFLNGDQQSGSN